MNQSITTRPVRATCVSSGKGAREIANGSNVDAGGFGFMRDGVW